MRRLLSIVFTIVAFMSYASGPAASQTRIVNAVILAHPDGVYDDRHCPWTFNFKATISYNSPGPISYRWIRSDGAKTAIAQMNPTTAGNSLVVMPWTFGAKGIYHAWVQIEFLAPSHRFSVRKAVFLQCD